MPLEPSAGADAARPADMATYAADKHRLLGELEGSVLEIGAGSGANLGHLGAGVRWIGLEPDRRRRRDLAGHSTVLAAEAEDVPLADDSVDAVIATVVLCSVADPDRVVAEVLRVLRPGGRFVFFEHVAAPQGTWTRRLLRACEPFSRRFDHGCRPTRETWRVLERAGFEELVINRYRRGRIPYIGGWGVAGRVAG